MDEAFMDAVWAIKGLSPVEHDILFALHRRADEPGKRIVSQIAKALGVSRQTVYSALERMKAQKYVASQGETWRVGPTLAVQNLDSPAVKNLDSTPAPQIQTSSPEIGQPRKAPQTLQLMPSERPVWFAELAILGDRFHPEPRTDDIFIRNVERVAMVKGWTPEQTAMRVQGIVWWLKENTKGKKRTNIRQTIVNNLPNEFASPTNGHKPAQRQLPGAAPLGIDWAAEAEKYNNIPIRRKSDAGAPGTL